MKEGKVEYLAMVQEAICRMSTTSGIHKGFSATVITGIAAVSFTDINEWVLLLSVFPVLSFLALDVYYLSLERKFRYLFNLIRTDEKEIDFSMSIEVSKGEKRVAKNGIWDCLISPSIWLFYLPSVLILGVIIIMKFKGVI